MQAIEVVAEPICKVRILRRGDQIVACVVLEGPEGNVTFCAKASIKAAQRLAAKYLIANEQAARTNEQAAIAGLFGIKVKLPKLPKIKLPKLPIPKGVPIPGISTITDAKTFKTAVHDLAKKVAKARVLRKVMKAVDDVTSDPMVAKAVGLAAIVYPPVGVPLATALAAKQAFDSSRSLLRRAAAGDLNAKNVLQTVVKGAAAGDPRARRMAQILAIVQRYKTQTAATAGFEIGRAIPRHGRVHGTLGLPSGRDVHVDASWQTAGFVSLGAM